LHFHRDANLIAGIEHGEDAGIYKLRDDLALVQTVDFFTPIVDEPYDFGRIAVANSLSDVYAMGGTPLTAMNVVCFPNNSMDISILREVLRGGLDAMHAAGVILVGGHTVDDPELKYGLSVTGIIHPERVIHNYGALPGDRLILTKNLGTGIISTAIKAGRAAPSDITAVTASMAALNRTASELMPLFNVHAATDITGFGLIGHAAEMIAGSSTGYIIETGRLPVFEASRKFAAEGMIPGGLHRNRDYYKNIVNVSPGISQFYLDIIYDPQTSGGLLMAVPADKAAAFVEKLHLSGVPDAAVIGEVTAENPGRIMVI